MRSSSFLVTLRTLVILVSLVAVPLWAVLGTAWHAKIISFFGGQARLADDVRADSAPRRDGLSEAPAFRSQASASSPTSVPPAGAGVGPHVPQLLAADEQAAAILPPQPVQLASGAPIADPRQATNQPAAYESPAPNPNRRAVVLGASSDPRDQFKGLERRLRELGATYYRLETWGENGELYRFHCQMGAADQAQPGHLFEATDRDAFQAMARVVHDVEGWRTGRLR